MNTIKLGVNVDHVATIRQARLIQEPDPVTAAALAELAGAGGITVHLREDRRHIQERDVRILRQTITTRLNLEMAATPEMTAFALDVRPDIVCVVPEKREELTTEGGLDLLRHRDRIRECVTTLQGAGIPVSLFIEPTQAAIEGASDIGAKFVELHTGRYADAKHEEEVARELSHINDAALYAVQLQIRVNAGHGLNYRNVVPVAQIAVIEELNIGHSIVGRAVLVGLERAVREMVELMRGA